MLRSHPTQEASVCQSQQLKLWEQLREQNMHELGHLERVMKEPGLNDIDNGPYYTFFGSLGLLSKCHLEM